MTAPAPRPTPSMRMSPLRRYIYGWQMYWWAMWKSLTKDHGAGPASLINAHRMGCCMRCGVDGQFRGKFPRYMRRGMRA